MNMHILTKNGPVIVLIVLLTGMYSNLSIAGDLKIGQVNLKGVFSASIAIQKIWQDVKKSEGDAKAKLISISNEVSSLEKKLKEEESKLKPEEKAKLQQALKEKREKQRTESEALRISLAFKQKNARTVSQSKILNAIARVADKKGLTLIVRQPMVLYSKDVPDITKDVVETIDAAGSAKNKESGDKSKKEQPKPSKK
jgi:Skp family chaperone for outer membrane proteins